MKRIAMVAGESSGDLLAVHLIEALRRHLPDAQLYGIGGPKMQAAGFEAWWPAETLAVNGYADVLRRYRELSGIRSTLLERLIADPPDVFIGIDAPDFNLWLEGELKARGVPAVHFVSPSIWAWRGGRIHKIKRCVSHMLCLFPFEVPLYEKAQVPASFVGHPLADSFPLQPDRAAARQALGLESGRRIVALLPGSRRGELRHMAETFIQSACALHARHADLMFVAPFATPATQAMFEEALQRLGARALPIRCLQGASHEAMIAADVVLVASGTASLEAALLKRPMVIVYKLSVLSYWIMKRMVYLPYVGLPNILAGEKLVPEFIQAQAQPEPIARALEHWLTQPQACAQLAQRFTEMHLQLRQNTAERAAAAILPFLDKALK